MHIMVAIKEIRSILQLTFIVMNGSVIMLYGGHQLVVKKYLDILIGVGKL